jgi:hypothetical protein
MNKYFLIVPTIGITLGATIAGVMMKKGRRKAFLIFPLVGVIGSILSVFDNYIVMMIGNYSSEWVQVYALRSPQEFWKKQSLRSILTDMVLVL